MCDIPAIDYSGVRHRGISGMSHKVSVWQASQLPSIQSCLSPCLPSCSNLLNSVDNPTAIHTRKNSKHLFESKWELWSSRVSRSLQFKGQTPRLLFEHGWEGVCNVLNRALNPSGVISTQSSRNVAEAGWLVWIIFIHIIQNPNAWTFLLSTFLPKLCLLRDEECRSMLTV